MTIQDEIWLLAHSENPEDRREWAVLYFKAQGLTHKQVADQLSYSRAWVQRYVSRAHKRFHTPDDLADDAERAEWLATHVYPPLREFISGHPELLKELPPPPQGEPPAEAGPLARTGVPVRVPPTRPPRAQRWRAYLFLAVLLVAASGIGYLIGHGPRPAPVATPSQLPLPSELASTGVPTSPAPPAPLIPTLAPTSSPAAEPSETSIAPSATAPVPTAFVPPANGILFQDDFVSGIGPDWSSGPWLTANGALTLMTSEAFNNRFDWISLDKPEWKNYDVSVKINIPFQGAAAQSSVAVAVRVGSQSRYIGVVVDTLSNAYLALLGDGDSNTEYIAGRNADFQFDSGSTLDLTVQGDTYTMKVDGRTIQTVTYPGYASGGVALGVECNSSERCPSFNNFKVVYLP